MKVKKKKIIYDDLEKSSQWSKILQKVIIVKKKTSGTKTIFRTKMPTKFLYQWQKKMILQLQKYINLNFHSCRASWWLVVNRIQRSSRRNWHCLIQKSCIQVISCSYISMAMFSSSWVSTTNICFSLINSLYKRIE